MANDAVLHSNRFRCGQLNASIAVQKPGTAVCHARAAIDSLRISGHVAYSGNVARTKFCHQTEGDKHHGMAKCERSTRNEGGSHQPKLLRRRGKRANGTSSLEGRSGAYGGVCLNEYRVDAGGRKLLKIGRKRVRVGSAHKRKPNNIRGHRCH